MSAPPPAARSGSLDPAAMDLIERLAARVQAGEALDPDALLREHPEHADLLRQVLPAMAFLADPNRAAPVPAAEVDPAGADEALGVLGDFRLLREVGRGGMGIVYEAEQLSLARRRVAVKVLPFAGAMDPSRLQRFQNEARAAACLQHANIVPVHSVGCDGGVHYYAMQLIDGCNLTELVNALRRRTRPELPDPDRRTVPFADPAEDGPDTDNAIAGSLSTGVSLRGAKFFETVARWGAAAAEGLHHAHLHQIVHRDVKPANLLVDGAGRLWVADFGLAQFQAEPGLTRSDGLLGTLRYMSPEQARADRVVIDHRADVYSLGATLYELITLEPAFPGRDTADILRRIETEEPRPPRSVNPAIPRDLETVVLKAMAKDPAHRYQSARDLAEDLGRFLAGVPVLARRPGPAEIAWRWARRHKAVAALCAVSAVALVAILALAFYLVVERGNRLLQEAEARVAGYHRLVNQVRERNRDQPPGWTSHGLDDLRHAAALVPDPGELPALRTAAAACLGGVTLTVRARVALEGQPWPLAFAPDGKTLYLGPIYTPLPEACRLFHVDVDRGVLAHTSRVPIPPDSSPDGMRSLAVSPDGRWLVAGMRDGALWRCDRPWNGPPEPFRIGHAGQVTGLAFAPGGAALYSKSSAGELRRWDVAGWENTATATLAADHCGGPICGRAGEWVACANERAGLVVFDPASLERRPTEHVPAEQLALGPDGRSLFLAVWRSLHLHDLTRLDGGPGLTLRQPGQEAADEEKIESLAVSPDGALLAAGCSATRHVRLWDVASGLLLADANVGGGTLQLAFSPDGRTLAVCGEREVVLYEVGSPARATVAVATRPLLDAAWVRGGPALAALTTKASHDAAELLFHAGPGAVAAPVGFLAAPGPRNAARAALAFSADGSRVAWLPDHDLAGWDPAATAAGGPLFPLDRAWSLQFDPAGRIWIAGAGGIRVVTVPTEPGSATWRTDAGRSPPRGEVVALWTADHVDPHSGMGVVRSLAVGRALVAAGIRDGSVALIDPLRVQTLLTRSVGDHPVQAVAFDVDESQVAFGTEAGVVGVLDATSGKELAKVHVHKDSVESVAFVTGELLASGSRDRTVRLWRWRDGRLDEILTLPFAGPVRRVAATDDGASLAVLVQGERAVRLWRLDALHAGLADLGLDPGFDAPVPGGKPFDARPWLAPPPAPRTLGRVRMDLYQGFNFERLVHTRFDSGIDWDRPGEPLDPGLNRGAPLSVRWTGWLKPPVAGTYTLSLEHTGAARLWLDGRLVQHADHSGRQADTEKAVDLTAEGHDLRVEYRNGGGPVRCRFWWTLAGERNPEANPSACLFPDRAAAEHVRPPAPAVRVFAGHRTNVFALAFSPDRRTVLSGGADGMARLWDVATGRASGDALRHDGRIDAVAYSPDGRLMLTADGPVLLWDVAERKELRRFVGHRNPPDQLVFAPDGLRFVSAGDSEDFAPRVWHIDGHELARLDGCASVVLGAAWLADGRIVTSEHSGAIRFWDPATGEQTDGVQYPFREACQLAVSPDGRRLVVSGGRGFAVYRLPECRLLWAHGGGPGKWCGGAVAFAPDGRTFAVGAYGVSSISLWGVDSGRELCRFGRGRLFVHALAFSPDGRHLLAGGDYLLEDMHLFRIPPEFAPK